MKTEPQINEKLASVRQSRDAADPSRAHFKRMSGWVEALEWVVSDG